MLIYGKNTVTEALKTKKAITKIYMSNDMNDQSLVSLAKKAHVETVFMPRGLMNKKFEGNHQGIVAEVTEYEYKELSEVIKKCSDKDAVIAMLDGLEDPHNLGAILRSADATGVDAIIIPKNRSVSLNATVAKVSTGALANVKIAQVTNLTQAIKELKNSGYWVYAAEAFNSSNYDSLDYKSPVALIVGSEGFGISRLVKEQADFNIKIPMTGKVNSLNVSVATAILVSYISLKQSV